MPYFSAFLLNVHVTFWLFYTDEIVMYCTILDPFAVYVTGKFKVRSAHVGVRKLIPSHWIVC